MKVNSVKRVDSEDGNYLNSHVDLGDKANSLVPRERVGVRAIGLVHKINVGVLSKGLDIGFLFFSGFLGPG